MISRCSDLNNSLYSSSTFTAVDCVKLSTMVFTVVFNCAANCVLALFNDFFSACALFTLSANALTLKWSLSDFTSQSLSIFVSPFGASTWDFLLQLVAINVEAARQITIMFFELKFFFLLNRMDKCDSLVVGGHYKRSYHKIYTGMEFDLFPFYNGNKLASFLN